MTEPTRSGPRGAARPGGEAASTPNSFVVGQLASAAFLLAMGAIHLYLRFHGTGGLLGMLFVLNAIGAVVLAVAVLVARGRALPLAALLGLVFMAGTLLALVLSLTTGLFGIRSSLDLELAPTTLVVESIGTIVLLATTAATLRPSRP